MHRKLNTKINLKITALMSLAVLIIVSGSVMAQQSLRDLAQEYGCNWLAGQWTATTDDGTEIILSYRWALDGHAVIVDFKMGEYASHGMIYYVPDDENATAISVDNRGGRAKGTWEVQGDRLVSKNVHVTAEGEVRKYATVHSKVDNKTIKIALYGLNEYNELSDEPWFTMNYKRQVKKTKKPAPKQKSN